MSWEKHNLSFLDFEIKQKFHEFYDLKYEIKELIRINKITKEKGDLMLIKKQYELFDKFDTGELINIFNHYLSDWNIELINLGRAL
ncbi:MAG: hypothetical protein Q4P18_07750 [Methanobrevibacter sp.]|uniref:hypothetical protein n=1 Tax=Methanobrevibacter sp. TaxID=66852 RepID=UPI0026E0D87E|nr:hypothetical protein [Methanobrevibacter sp.]MDO5849413.1 hypothetical protein [Methanobrevibacter sp.]